MFFQSERPFDYGSSQSIVTHSTFTVSAQLTRLKTLTVMTPVLSSLDRNDPHRRHPIWGATRMRLN
jgi:hypothetical protein